MTSPTDLARLAAQYAAAVNRLTAMRAYRDNLPAYPDYDLGVRVDLQWGSSTDGYQEIRAAVQQRVAADMRAHIDAAVEAAVAEERRLRAALAAATKP